MVGEVKKVVVKEELKFFAGFGVGEYLCCLDNQGRIWRRPVSADNDFGKWMLIEGPQIEQLERRSEDSKAERLHLETELGDRLDRITALQTVSKKLLDENNELKVKVAELEKKIADAFIKNY